MAKIEEKQSIIKSVGTRLILFSVLFVSIRPTHGRKNSRVAYLLLFIFGIIFLLQKRGQML
jgi:hypothetical protein